MSCKLLGLILKVIYHSDLYCRFISVSDEPVTRFQIAQ